MNGIQQTALSSRGDDPLGIRLMHPGAEALRLVDERYTKIIYAIIQTGGRKRSAPSISFQGRFVSRDGELDRDVNVRSFHLNSESITQVANTTFAVIEIMNRISGITESPEPVTDAPYAQEHDEYLQDMMHFHQAFVSQATSVLSVLRDIREVRKIIDNGNDVVLVGSNRPINPERPVSSYFPGNEELTATEIDIKTVRAIIRRHRNLYQYVARIRRELFNCLTDDGYSSIFCQDYALKALKALSQLLGLACSGSASASQYFVRRQAAEFYSGMRLYNRDDRDFQDDGDNFDDLVNLVRHASRHGTAADATYVPDYLRNTWCHISKSFHDERQVANVCIIPATTPHKAISSTFGDLDATVVLNSPRNCILMLREIANNFIDGRLSVVPCESCSDEAQPMEFRLFFIDRSLMTSKSLLWFKFHGSGAYKEYRWCDLAQNPRLLFRNDYARPGLRNLFYHCVTSLVRAKRYRYPGYTEAVVEFEQRIVWPTTGPWIAQPILKSLAASLGMPKLYRKETLLDEEEAREQNSAYDVSSMLALTEQPPHYEDLEKW